MTTRKKRATVRAILSAALFAVAGLGLAGSAQAIDPPIHQFSFGSTGTTEGKMSTPFDMATDSTGNVYVTDYAQSRVHKWSKTGTFIKRWGVDQGYDNPENPWQEIQAFDQASGIAIDTQNRLFVGDAGNHRIKVQDDDGIHLNIWGGYTETKEAGKFYVPNSVALDRLGNVYVWDRWEQISRFAPNGTLLNRWDMPDDFGLGEFGFEGTTITVDRDGNVYAASCQADRIVKFNVFGQILSQFGTPGSGNGRFNCPTGLATDRNGNLFVVDRGNKRVQVFDRQNKFLLKWSGTGGNTTFKHPIGLHIDNSGQIFVSDVETDKIHKYKFAVPLP